MYTSGSTGYPKGVLGTHTGLINRLVWQYKQYPFKTRSSNIGDDNDDSEEGSQEDSEECSLECSEGVVRDFNSVEERTDHQEKEIPTVIMDLNTIIDDDKRSTTDDDGNEDQHDRVAVGTGDAVNAVNSDDENAEHASVASTSEIDAAEGIAVTSFKGEVVCRRTPVSPV